MAVEQVTKQSALVFRDTEYTHRWYDAIGKGVVKYLQEFVYWPVDDTTHDPVEWTCSIVEAGTGDSTARITDLAGGALLITTAQSENDGWAMQLGHAYDGAGENVYLEPGKQVYVGAEFAIGEATETDLLLGLCITDTDCLGAVSDGVYFRKIDGSTSLGFVTEKDSAESETVVATLAKDTYYTIEFYYDGATIRAYFNGGEITSTADSAITFPDNEALRLTVEFLNGATGAARTCTIKWLRMIHLSQA